MFTYTEQGNSNEIKRYPPLVFYLKPQLMKTNDYKDFTFLFFSSSNDSQNFHYTKKQKENHLFRL